MDSIQSIIKAACNDHGDVDFRSDYSGRGMYGSRCVGIVGSYNECLRVVGAIIQQLTQQLFETAIDCDDGSKDAVYAENDTVQELIGKLMAFDTDSMGRNNLLYWKDIESRADEADESLTDEWIDQQSEQTLLLWVRENSEYYTGDDSVENHGDLVATVKLMRDRIAEDVK